MKKYILKPGNHQFAPRSPAIHNNQNITDEQAEWYLTKFPHILDLFEITAANICNQEPALIDPIARFIQSEDEPSTAINQ